MGAMNFFRALASAFVVAVMGAIMLAQLGTAPQRGGAHRPRSSRSRRRVTSADLARTFSYIFAVAVLFLIVGIVALILMEERPLRTTVLAAPAAPETPPGRRRSSAGRAHRHKLDENKPGGKMDR